MAGSEDVPDRDDDDDEEGGFGQAVPPPPPAPTLPTASSGALSSSLRMTATSTPRCVGVHCRACTACSSYSGAMSFRQKVPYLCYHVYCVPSAAYSDVLS